MDVLWPIDSRLDSSLWTGGDVMRLGQFVGLLALSGMWSCGGEEPAAEQGPGKPEYRD